MSERLHSLLYSLRLVVNFAKDAHVHLCKMQYCEVLGDVAAFEPALWALAVEQAIPYAGVMVVTADGAA